MQDTALLVGLGAAAAALCMPALRMRLELSRAKHPSLAGHARQTETVLFYTRGDEEKPPQMVYEKGPYAFKLILDDGSLESGRQPPSVEFVRELRWYDARAFNEGTIPMYAKNWRSAVNA